MSYLKADQLMQLATLMSSRHRGVTLDQVKEEFDVSHRTAQRMMRAIEQQFMRAPEKPMTYVGILA